jgi:hypothetical protein
MHEEPMDDGALGVYSPVSGEHLEDVGHCMYCIFLLQKKSLGLTN